MRRAEFSSEQPLSELLRRQSRKEEPLRELTTSSRQRSDEVFRSELLSASRKDSRRAEPLPSASDYSDLESPERETGWSALQAYLREAIPRKNFGQVDKGALLFTKTQISREMASPSPFACSLKIQWGEKKNLNLCF